MNRQTNEKIPTHKQANNQKPNIKVNQINEYKTTYGYK